MMGRGTLQLDTWHGYACVESISPYVWVCACDVAFVIRCDHSCGETRVDMLVSVVALHVSEWTRLDGTAFSFNHGISWDLLFGERRVCCTHVGPDIEA